MSGNMELNGLSSVGASHSRARELLLAIWCVLGNPCDARHPEVLVAVDIAKYACVGARSIITSVLRLGWQEAERLHAGDIASLHGCTTSARRIVEAFKYDGEAIDDYATTEHLRKACIQLEDSSPVVEHLEKFEPRNIEDGVRGAYTQALTRARALFSERDSRDVEGMICLSCPDGTGTCPGSARSQPEEPQERGVVVAAPHPIVFTFSATPGAARDAVVTAAGPEVRDGAARSAGPSATPALGRGSTTAGVVPDAPGGVDGGASGIRHDARAAPNATSELDGRVRHSTRNVAASGKVLQLGAKAPCAAVPI